MPDEMNSDEESDVLYNNNDHSGSKEVRSTDYTIMTICYMTATTVDGD